MDLTLIQFLSQCRDEEAEAMERWLHDFQPISWITAGSIRFAKGATCLADFLSTTESSVGNI